MVKQERTDLYSLKARRRRRTNEKSNIANITHDYIMCIFCGTMRSRDFHSDSRLRRNSSRIPSYSERNGIWAVLDISAEQLTRTRVEFQGDSWILAFLLPSLITTFIYLLQCCYVQWFSHTEDETKQKLSHPGMLLEKGESFERELESTLAFIKVWKKVVAISRMRLIYWRF
jgi:hypothetical protein